MQTAGSDNKTLALGKKIDVYAFALLTWALLRWRPPFYGVSTMQILSQVKHSPACVLAVTTRGFAFSLIGPIYETACFRLLYLTGGQTPLRLKPSGVRRL